MNHKTALHLLQSAAPPRLGKLRSKRLFMLVLAAWTVAATGCFRATGIQRSPMVAEVLPETAGDSVAGLKSKAGAGDLYLGNDFIQVAIDSTVYGDPTRTPIAGAASGGSIVDAGYIWLNSNYTRVSMPGNVMNRLTPVVNQDPRLQMVFSQYVPSNSGSVSTITMTGGILDPQNILQTGTSISSPLVAGVTVTHSLSLTQLERFFTLTTTVTNNSATTIPVLNIGDYLIQQGGGYSFNIPANFDYQGNALTATIPGTQPVWGVQIPATVNWNNPLQTSVQAGEVGLLNTEPGADTVDSHCSLGFLPVDADQLLVASDPQDLLTVAATVYPTFNANLPAGSPQTVPANLVVGSLPAPAGLAPGASLTHNRRLFIIGGRSVDGNTVGGLTIAAPYPDQGTGLFNLMDTYRYADITLRPVQDLGVLTFTLSGVSQRQGPLPTQVRIERNVTAVTPPIPGQTAAATWQLQRTEYFVPNENIFNQGALAPSTLSVRLPVGIYRMVLSSPNATQTRTLFENTNVVASPTGINQVGSEGPLWIQKDQNFVVSANDILCPDAAPDPNPNQIGPITSNPYTPHYFITHEMNSPTGNLQPLRMTFVRTDQPVPVMMRRMRTLATYYDPTNYIPQVAPGAIAGQYQFRGGNELFGTGFTNFVPTEFAWFANGGSYLCYGTRGPLSELVTMPLQAFDGQPNTSHTLDVTPMGLPPNWTSFDLPGPGQTTTGGYLPSEKLASAMANGIQVVAHAEQDLQVDGVGLYDNFRTEFGSVDLQPYMIPAALNAITRPPGFQYGYDPFVVGGRSSSLNGYGNATALFTPPPSDAPMGGAFPSQTWVLADFLAQAQGLYNVVNRPRGPQGLFTLQGAPTQGTPATAFSGWWTGSGPLSFGMTNGKFDAIELLRGESLDPADPSAWFAEFLQVRSDWFGLLNLQSPSFFTKALGLSAASFSIDTPVGLARTYLKAFPTTETDLSGILSALQTGAAVASTGPFLDVSVGTAGPGQLVPGPVQNVNLTINLWRTSWMPVDEIRVIVNGTLALTIDPATLVPSGADTRQFTGSFSLPMAQLTGGQEGWIVVEAGVPLATTGAYAPVAYPAWPITMRGIYPIAVTNPIFVDVKGNGYPTPTP